MIVALLGLDHAAIALGQGAHAGKAVALTEALARLTAAGDAEDGTGGAKSEGGAEPLIQRRSVRLQKVKYRFIFTKLGFHLAQSL
jgi:hypothetical protein